ncbi:MAG: Coq4 family protein [Pseudomonadota bacterium]
MDRSQLKQIFVGHVAKPISLDHIQQLTAGLLDAGRKASRRDRLELAAALAHAAFLAPDQVAALYDRISETWLSKKISADPVPTLDRLSETPPEALWAQFWEVAEEAADGKLDALSITERTAALGGEMPEAFVERVAAMSHTYPGISEAVRAPMPRKIDLDHLAAQPDGSIGAEFHNLIISNKFDLEVLDRNEIGLAALPSPLDFLNTRILQSHDLWHITAGYETTALHEIALSAFQMAQFGHNYSAQFLSIVAAVGAISPASGYKVLMDTVTTSWAHGRETYPMMLIPWEDVWHKTAEEIRRDYGIHVYERPYRADLIERAAPIASIVRKLNAFFARFRTQRAVNA